MADDNWWSKDSFATAAAAKAAPTNGRAKTTAQDMMLMRDSTARAEAERNAQQEYASTRKAVVDMDTGPLKAAYLDAITPDQDGGVLDKIGGFLGAPLRLLVSGRTLAARDHLNTVSAQVALKGSQQMKGSSSDKDTALMRTAGVSPYKTKEENLRILDAARRDSMVEQRRADLKARWISRFGSISAPGPNGLTYEDAASRLEAPPQRSLPKPPPNARRAAGGRIVIDLDVNPIR